MRALSCLDARVSYAPLAQVAASAGSDAVVVGDDVVGNPELCRRLRERHLGVVLNLPLLFDPRILASLPSSYAVSSTGRRAVAAWPHMACPRSDEFWERRLETMGRALDDLQPDMVSLDFARSFVRPVSHLRALHDEIRRTTARPLMPWLQAAEPYATEPLALDSLSAMLAVVAGDGDLGYSIFHLDGIAPRPEVLSILAA